MTSDPGDSGTILQVDSTAGFNESEGMLLIETEFVKYCGKTDTSFCVSERGALGSTRSSHSADTSIQFAKSMITTVTGISGNRITLKDPATFTVRGAPVEVGAVHLANRNLHFDGNKVTGPHQNQVCLALAWARFFRIEQCVFQNGDHGGIVVRISQDGWITDNYLSDNGQPTMQTGANLWLFANCRNIRVTRNIIGGGSMVGIAIDDRTSQAFRWQGPCEDNLIKSNLIAGKGAKNLAVGILVDGASRNLVTNDHILDCETGIRLSEVKDPLSPRYARTTSSASMS